jgi:prepilin-type N-terminal cleavage/methylation domain-containing protein
MESASRRGVSLIELAVVLSLLGVIGAVIGTTLLRQQRFYRGATELLYAREGVRDALEVLSTDIRGASIADTVRVLSDSAIELFANVGSSVVCQIAGGIEVGLPGPSPARGNALTALLVEPDTGELVLFYDDSPGADRWERHRIAAFSSRSQSTSCPDSGAFSRGVGVGGLVLALAAPLSGQIRPGAPVRFIRRGRYSLYRASDGEWYLGYRRCNAVGVSSCGPIQPLSGPYRGYNADRRATGLLFEYFDEQGRRLDAESSPLFLARVDITARAGSRQAMVVEGRSWGSADSATVSIAVRNAAR